VIARADGTPLYNLAVAIDDLDSGITHVVRGEDHLSNTPKQVLVLQALGAEPPIYAHLPLLHGPDGKKLSKRHGAASVQELRDAGYLPEAVINYIALLGAGYDPEREIFPVEELQELFSLDRVSKSPAVFDERKLRHINGLYIRELPLDDLTARLERFTGRSELSGAVEISREKFQRLDEFEPLCGFLFREPVDDPKAFEKIFGKDGSHQALEAVREALGGIEGEWTQAAVEAALDPLPERLEMGAGKVYQPLRVAITGTTISPGIFESVAALGRDLTLSRVDSTLTTLASRSLEP
jgi:glutamyl-tRNA synthetase